MFARFGRHVRQQFVGYVALFVALGGVSYAATVLPRNSVGSPQIKNGQVKAADLANNAVTSAKIKDFSLLAKDFKPGQLVAGSRGPAGPQGAKGDAGTAGQPGTPGAPGQDGTSALRLFASVNENQVVVRSNPSVTIVRVFAGLYRVDFGRDVSACTPIATVGATSAGNNLQPGEAGATPVTSEVTKIGVATRDSAGAFADKPFQLALACP
jgi:hypothetical protein